MLSTHMLDLSEPSLPENIQTSARYLARITKLVMTFELEIGITGGAEDGVDHRGVEHDRFYTSPADVLNVYDALAPVGAFNLAAASATHTVSMRAATSSCARPSCANRSA